jgi:hypothetical protein
MVSREGIFRRDALDCHVAGLAAPGNDCKREGTSPARRGNANLATTSPVAMGQQAVDSFENI